MDRVIVKTVSRFARNVEDCLKYIRELTASGVSVYFEEEGIDTAEMPDETILAIRGVQVQHESSVISKNLRWSYQKRMQEGTFITSHAPIGYQLINNTLVIDEKTAPIVRRIFADYLGGKGSLKVAHELNAEGVPTGEGCRWTATAVKGVLKNEKYMGDAVSQKTYIQDIFSKKSVKNTGQLPQYYITDSHEGIISKEVFKRVKCERARRRSMAPVTGKTKTNAGRFAPKYALTGLLLCGECGHHYRRTTWYRKSGTKVVWRCTNRLDNGSRFCRESHTISEPALHKALAKFIAGLANPKDELAQTLEDYTMEVIEQETGSAKKKELQEKQEQTEKRMQLILSADIICEELIEKISEEYDQLKQEIEKLSDQRETMERHKAYLNGIRECLQDADFDTMQYDDRLVSQVIEQIIVKSKDRLYIRVKGGYETEIILEEE